MKPTLRTIFLATSCIAAGSTAQAHAIVGDRAFPATMAVEDPGISDEVTLPQISRFKEPGEDGAPAQWTTRSSASFAKRVTEDFGVEIGDEWVNQGGTQGRDNVELGAKYVFFRNAPHEVMLSAGLDADIGGSGAKRIGAESFSTWTPAIFFGKGMGDLPDSMALLKPLAVTGTVGYALPSREFTTDHTTGDRNRNGQALDWGFTVQYSIPYLQQHVQDLGLMKPFSTAIPVVEFAMETPTGGEGSGSTTGTINPGIIFMGQQTQFAVEAIIPVNSDSGHRVGAMAQMHFYLDNIFPQSIGKPLW